jgi:F-type H+-transporting ATPase subunit c
VRGRRYLRSDINFAGLAVSRRSRQRKKVVDMSMLAFLALNNEVGGSLLGGNVHVGLAALGAAIGVGMIGTAASTAVGRNPGASTKVLVQSILSIAFAEAIVFYTLFLVKG